MQASCFRVEDVVPHRPPMVLIDEIVSFDPAAKSLVAAFTARDEWCENYVAIEYMAQSAAALVGMSDRASDPSAPARPGFLLGTRRLDLSIERFEPGARYTVAVVNEFADDDAASFRCSVEDSSGATVAKAIISAYRPKEIPAALLAPRPPGRKRGCFVTFEGGEGSGKSTQIRRLSEALTKAGIGHVMTREPGGTALAERIRAMLGEKGDDPPCGKAELMLFLAARAQAVEKVVAPALDAGKWVICDRFCDSTLAYQGYGRGLPLDELRAMNRFVAGGTVPDVTFLLDVPLEASKARRLRREALCETDADRIESEGDEFHSRVRSGFLELAAGEPGRFVVVDATAGVDAVWERIWTSIRPMI